MSIDLSKYSVRTDIALEDLETNENRAKHIEVSNVSNLEVTKVTISKELEEEYGKKEGLYYTIETEHIAEQDRDLENNAIEALGQVLRDMIKELGIKDDDSCLVIGLGNKDITPDALGPIVSTEIIVTNHIFELQPESISDNYRRVYSIVPGVMGQTGIETSDIIKSVVAEIKPGFIIAVDALASRSINRVNRTIQITDAGINPGSGVGNSRKEISKDVLGIPVIAIGVPTVVDAISITSDTIDFMLKYLSNELDGGFNKLVPPSNKRLNYDKIDLPDTKLRKELMGEIGLLDDMEKREIIYEALSPSGLNMMVTPKEVDTSIEMLAEVISRGIDRALHKELQQ